MLELKGKPVADALAGRLAGDIRALGGKGVVPRLEIIRVGENPDDIAYEKGIVKRFSSAGALAETIALPPDAPQARLNETVASLNADAGVHGILVFRPLPRSLSEDAVKALIDAEKDVDGMGAGNMARVFAGGGDCFPPCTPQAVLETLDYYGIGLAGRRVAVVGRSLVVGKPLAMLLLARNATVTICHTRTADLAGECRRADILVACAGRAGLITEDFVHPDQIVVDVGINVVEGRLCGDVEYEAAAGRVRALTPVPGGIGSVTASVLLKHTVASAMRR